MHMSFSSLSFRLSTRYRYRNVVLRAMPKLTHTGHAHVHVVVIVIALAIYMSSSSLSDCRITGHAHADTGHTHVHVVGIIIFLAINMLSLSLSQCCIRGHAQGATPMYMTLSSLSSSPSRCYRYRYRIVVLRAMPMLAHMPNPATATMARTKAWPVIHRRPSIR